MKTFTLLAIFLFSPIGLGRVAGATLLLDDFSSGSFSLASGGTTSNSAAFASPLTDRRTISGVGIATSIWAITLAPEELAYTANQLPPLTRPSSLSLYYSKTIGTFSILGYEAFAIDLRNVVGSGELIVSVSGSGGRDSVVPIVGSGTVISPFSFLDTTQSLGSISAINFRINAVSEDFSLSIDNVRLIPEPSSSLLIILGIASTALHRCRRK